MLLMCFTMEQALFGDYEGRLKFDDTLVRMHAEFEQRKEHLRELSEKMRNLEQPNGTSVGDPAHIQTALSRRD